MRGPFDAMRLDAYHERFAHNVRFVGLVMPLKPTDVAAAGSRLLSIGPWKDARGRTLRNFGPVAWARPHHATEINRGWLHCTYGD